MQPSGDRSNRVRALLSGTCAVALAAVALAGCSGSDGAGSGTAAADAANGGQTVAAAPPGKYRVLPEPCGSVSAGTIASLVPNAADPDGEASVTFDTDRKVGCKWTGRTALGNRYLQIDLERVVSYDSAVSDDDQAATDYRTRATDAGIPLAPADGGPGAPTPPGAPTSSTSPSSTGVSAPPSSSPSGIPQDVAPRFLDGLGDDAFLDDALRTRDSGVHRDVTVVFRIANVLVTVGLSQWSTDKSVEPPSPDLQAGARQVAAELADQLDE
ncbi:hypothetical protein ACIP98_11890 [Streptomyces sp. NPDC088354]|uniref:hypothetical protein n=1 Tax=Streptomyces sp. NPDC088354 TaxID=3365856 RepID=UPI003814C52F